MGDAGAPRWWQRGIVYQIYPRSFQDSNGDGIGDLPGVTARLDHLVWLGVDALWLSPFYPSPMADFGYDVADHCGVDPRFGTLADFDRLLAAAHDRGLKVILDYVPNHTSDRHPWFRQARLSRASPKRDWYIWRDPAAGGWPPNNWRASFGGSAWEYDPVTAQYYYHAFLKEQPDLNWRNPEVQRAMLDVLRFWLDRGVDGFRVDAVWHLAKDPEFRDNPPNPAWRPEQGPYHELLPRYTTDLDEVLDHVAMMRAVLDEYDDRVMVTEAYIPVHRLVRYYGPRGRGAHLPFNFQLVTLPWDARVIAEAVENYEALLPEDAWPNWVLGNHDRRRVASRVGRAQARVAAMLLLTLRGTPTTYYGDEIGMVDVPIPPDRVQDPWERNVPGLGLGRDPARTPMQWDGSPNAGFTSGTPWLPLAADAREVNVAAQRRDGGSLLRLYRRLVALRRSEPALEVGGYAPVVAEGDLVAYVRKHDARRLLIVLNLGSRPATLEVPGGEVRGRVVLSTHLDRDDEPTGAAVSLRGDEGVIVALG